VAHHQLLGERVAQAHLHTPLDLAFDRLGVQRRATVVCGVDMGDAYAASFLVDLNLGDLRAEAEGRRDQTHVAGCVGAAHDERLAVPQALHHGDCLAEPDRLLGPPLHAHHPVLALEGVDDVGVELQRQHLVQLFFDLAGSVEDGVPDHEGDSTAPGAEVALWRKRGVARVQGNIAEAQAQVLGEDLLQHRIGALADVGGHGEQVHGAVGVGADLGGAEGILRVEPVEVAAGDEAVAADADAAARPLLAPLAPPIAHLRDLFQALGKGAGTEVS
jgi:hypothetical protein